MNDYRHTVPERNRTGNRTGYTTGSNAAAATKASTIALLTGRFPETVTLTLPIGEKATFTPVEMQFEPDGSAFCCMVKDAGDDPDVTHGALICARVQQDAHDGQTVEIALEGGVGVGRVTLPGIGLPVGAPAINIVPQQQIREAVQEAVLMQNQPLNQLFTVTISVPDGEKLAEKTLNARLGILGGISILGTTGKVFAYSTASWRASVIQAVEVAAANHPNTVILTTGGRSERYAMTLLPDALPKAAFVQLSVFTGAGIETCARMGVERVLFVGMTGKMIKTAQGHMQTHVAGNQVDFDFLRDICHEIGVDETLTAQVGGANTGRHFLELCEAFDEMRPVQAIVDLAQKNLEAFVVEKGRPDLPIDVWLVDFNEARIVAKRQSKRVALSQNDVDRPLMARLADNPATAYDDDQDGRHITAK